MTATASRLELRCAGGVGRIILTASEQRNAINYSWCQDFLAAAKRCAADTSLRVILLEAKGDYFSVGGDIAEFVAEKADLERHVRKMADTFHEGLLTLHRAPVPLVAAVAGIAAGGGFSLALSADLILAAQSARFVSAYTASGLSPDGGLSYILPRVVGLRKAFEIMALNPTLSAAEAQSLGIVSQVFDDNAFAAEVEDCVGRLAVMSPSALAALKELLTGSLNASLPEQLAAEAQQVAKLAGSSETLAMLEAFMARRRGGQR